MLSTHNKHLLTFTLFLKKRFMYLFDRGERLCVCMVGRDKGRGRERARVPSRLLEECGACLGASSQDPEVTT